MTGYQSNEPLTIAEVDALFQRRLAAPSAPVRPLRPLRDRVTRPRQCQACGAFRGLMLTMQGDRGWVVLDTGELVPPDVARWLNDHRTPGWEFTSWLCARCRARAPRQDVAVTEQLALFGAERS